MKGENDFILKQFIIEWDEIDSDVWSHDHSL